MTDEQGQTKRGTSACSGKWIEIVQTASHGKNRGTEIRGRNTQDSRREKETAKLRSTGKDRNCRMERPGGISRSVGGNGNNGNGTGGRSFESGGY